MSQIFIAKQGNTHYLKFEGEIRLLWVESLLNWWTEQVVLGDSISIDIQSCTLLDSTMVGSLVLLHHQNPAIIWHFILNADQVSYYGALGLMFLGSNQTTPISLPSLIWKPMYKKNINKTTAYKRVQETHQALISLKEGNLALFRDLMKGLSHPHSDD